MAEMYGGSDKGGSEEVAASLATLLRVDSIIPRYLRDVAELPDRTSPEGQPGMMLITGDELDTLLRRFALEVITGEPE